jgi:hypothetical protein
MEDRSKDKYIPQTSMIIYKLGCRTCLLQWNYSMELGERRKGKENNIVKHKI